MEELTLAFVCGEIFSSDDPWIELITSLPLDINGRNGGGIQGTAFMTVTNEGRREASMDGYSVLCNISILLRRPVIVATAMVRLALKTFDRTRSQFIFGGLLATGEISLCIKLILHGLGLFPPPVIVKEGETSGCFRFFDEHPLVTMFEIE